MKLGTDSVCETGRVRFKCKRCGKSIKCFNSDIIYNLISGLQEVIFNF
jgi:hypothetical protein